MKKTYNLGNPSDMRKYAKDLEATVMELAHKEIMSRKYDVICPNCKKEVSVKPGKSACPICREEIDLQLDIHS